MNEADVRKIIKEELSRTPYRFPVIPPHNHDGVNNSKIPQTSIIPVNRAIGKITFASAKTYTLYFPSSGLSRIDVNGFAENSGITSYALIVGNAIIAPALYFQPNNTSSVKVGGMQYPVLGAVATSDTPRIAQCCSSLLIDQSNLGNTFPLIDQFRAVHANNVSGIVVSGYFNNLTKNSIDLIIETLASGWKAVLNITIS